MDGRTGCLEWVENNSGMTRASLTSSLKNVILNIISMETKNCCNTQEKNTLFPLYVLLTSIFLLSIVLSYLFSSNTFMMYLMWIWFLAFWTLKLPDIRSFAQSFAQYDIIAQKWYPYGYIYPFIEIVLGILYIFNTQMLFMREINIIALLVSILWIVSAYRVIASKKKVLCACMGTYWKLPMTKVTILENGAMFLMIVYMMMYPHSMMNMKGMSMDDMDGMMQTDNLHIWSDGSDVNTSQILESYKVNLPQESWDAGMREHCQMMPEMAGCEAYR